MSVAFNRHISTAYNCDRDGRAPNRSKFELAKTWVTEQCQDMGYTFPPFAKAPSGEPTILVAIARSSTRPEQIADTRMLVAFNRHISTAYNWGPRITNHQYAGCCGFPEMHFTRTQVELVDFGGPPHKSRHARAFVDLYAYKQPEPYLPTLSSESYANLPGRRVILGICIRWPVNINIRRLFWCLVNRAAAPKARPFPSVMLLFNTGDLNLVLA